LQDHCSIAPLATPLYIVFLLFLISLHIGRRVAIRGTTGRLDPNKYRKVACCLLVPDSATTRMEPNSVESHIEMVLQYYTVA